MDVKYLTKPEMQRVLEAAKANGARDWAIVAIALRYGARSQELANLTIQDIKGGIMHLRRVKGSEGTVDPIDSLLDCDAALLAYLAVRPDVPCDSLFISRRGVGMLREAFYQVFAKAAEAAGIEEGRRNIHIAKHTLCVMLRKSGASIEVIAKTVGHKDYNTTYRYYAHVGRDECQRAASQALTL